MDILKEATIFENAKMSRMTTSDRIAASKEAKRLVLAINEIYKNAKSKKATMLMDLMKRLTAKKKKIDIRLYGRPDLGI